MTHQETIAQLEKLTAENNALRAAAAKRNPGVSFRVSPKGAVSAYGLGQYPVTLYPEQFVRLLDKADECRKFIVDNATLLSAKEDTEATTAAKAELRAKAGIKAKPFKKAA